MPVVTMNINANYGCMKVVTLSMKFAVYNTHSHNISGHTTIYKYSILASGADTFNVVLQNALNYLCIKLTSDCPKTPIVGITIGCKIVDMSL